MPGPLAARLRAIVDAVERSPRLAVLDSRRHLDEHPADDLAFARDEIEQQTGWRPPEALDDLLVMPERDRFGLAWKVAGSEDPELIGEFSLRGLWGPLTGEGDLDPPSDLPEEELDRFLAVRRFDDLSYRDFQAGTVLLPEPGGRAPSLWFYDKTVLLPMELGIEGYVDALGATWGLPYWQLLYCSTEVARTAALYKREALSKAIAALEGTLPAPAWAEARRRFDERFPGEATP